jgi:hypothetical protein
MVTQRVGRQTRQRTSDWSAFDYCCCPKLGVVLQMSSNKAFRDFQVNPEWIWSLLQAGKVSLPGARAEIVRCRKNLSRHLQNWEVLDREVATTELAEQIRVNQEEFNKRRQPFKRIPQVQRFLALAQTPSERRPVLVLGGPSRLGKTQFVTALVPPGCCVDVNCSGVLDPPLRSFDMRAHSLILFDEASVQMVLKNRKLFQAPNALVTLGTSPTNRDAYSVYLNDTLLVICSNSWTLQVSLTPSVDAEWIRKNQVYVDVSEPLWVDAPETRSGHGE